MLLTVMLSNVLHVEVRPFPAIVILNLMKRNKVQA
jgi:hypothetical protein